jgi:hypothetical protein
MGTEEFKIITSEDGSYAVVRVDPDQPRFLEVIATFYDAGRARDYARFENNRSDEPREAEPEPEREEKEPATPRRIRTISSK